MTEEPISPQDKTGWRVITWNLDYWQRHEAQIGPWDLISRTGAEVVLLQEVRGSLVSTLRAACQGESRFSQELHPHGSLRWMGCAVLLPAGGSVLEAGLVCGLPKAQRSLWARIALPWREPVTVVSWHAPNAAGDGREAKMAAYARMHEWLAGSSWPLVIGADLNTWTDPVDLQPPDADDPFYEERDFVGATARHRLVDAYRAVAAEQGELDRLRTERPCGPLAVSHVLPGGDGHRMDRIFVSPDLQPLNAGYCYHEAIAAGSDHALHWADLAKHH